MVCMYLPWDVGGQGGRSSQSRKSPTGRKRHTNSQTHADQMGLFVLVRSTRVRGTGSYT